MEYKFSFNIVARHHSMTSSDIASEFGLEPYNAWSVGDSRATPAGTSIAGVHAATMCSFIEWHVDRDLTAALLSTAEYLKSHCEFLTRFIDSGGTLSLNVGINGQFNSGGIVSLEVLQILKRLNIELSFECFPDG